MHVLNGVIVEVVDKNLDVIYDENGANPEYKFYEEYDLQLLIDYCKDTVESVLSSPTSAEYPDTWMDPYNGWGFGKTGSILIIQSYVDSKNAFNAMIRTHFTFKINKEDGEYSVVYFKFGDDVLVNKK